MLYFINLYGWKIFCFFIHSFVTGYLEWFPNLTIVDSATISIEMQVSLWCDDLELELQDVLSHWMWMLGTKIFSRTIYIPWITGPSIGPLVLFFSMWIIFCSQHHLLGRLLSFGWSLYTLGEGAIHHISGFSILFSKPILKCVSKYENTV